MTNRQFLQETNFENEKDHVLNDDHDENFALKQTKSKEYQKWQQNLLNNETSQ